MFSAPKKGKRLVTFDHENVNSLCSRHHQRTAFLLVSIEFKKNDF